MPLSDWSVETLNADPEARLEFLVEAGVFELDGEDVRTSLPFEDTRSIYADTYGEGALSRDAFVDTVADLFDLTTEQARSRVEDGDVSRHEIVTYLSLQSFLDRDLPQETLASLAEMAAAVGIGSPVPDGMRELTDEDHRAFLESAGEAVVFVWSYPCDPCRQMKGELPGVLDRIPDHVAVAGVDGDTSDAFRAAFDVDSAPTVLLFADGAVAARYEGYTAPRVLTETVAEVYDGDPA